jgi:hypothetical protein
MKGLAPMSLVLLLSQAASAFQPDGPDGAGSGPVITNMTSDRSGVSVRRDDEPMIEGSGRIVRRERAVGAFTTIHVQAPARVEVVVGGTPSVEIEADDNVIDFITTDTDGRALQIGTAGSFQTRTAPVVRITVAQLDRIRSQGSGDVRISGLAGDRFELIGQGSGNFVVEGRASSSSAKLYGSGDADLAGLHADDLDVAVYGSGHARVHATGTLAAAIYGSGSITYSGRPTEVSRSIHGMGRIGEVER